MFKNFVMNRGRFSDGAYKVLPYLVQTYLIANCTSYFTDPHNASLACQGCMSKPARSGASQL
jgi:hypothetical protein